MSQVQPYRGAVYHNFGIHRPFWYDTHTLGHIEFFTRNRPICPAATLVLALRKPLHMSLNRSHSSSHTSGSGQWPARHTQNRSPRSPLRWTLAGLGLVLGPFLLPLTAHAQSSTPLDQTALPAPTFWYILAAALAMLVPAGLILVSIGGLDQRQAWHTALGGVAAMGLAVISYWMLGFALQFGGIGLVYPQPELRALVWEWSPLSVEWGIGWGMAGLSGWFLSGSAITATVYALFLAHLPWVIMATALPVMALRGRAPALVTFIIAVLIGGVIYPLAGNWVQGGGWLSALGRNLNLGHGFVDFGGAGTVFLVAGSFAMVALATWNRSTARREPTDPTLPAAQLPLLAVVGAILTLAGAMGWLWTNPLQVEALRNVALLRGSVNILLSAAAGVLVPLVYTWFVGNESHPLLSARGLVAGFVTGLAVGPFVQPGPAFLLGFLAGGTVPFVTYFVDQRLHAADATGILSTTVVPALLGLLGVGVLADGAAGRGWQMTGMETFLGVTGQGVSGLLVGSGFQPNFPGQFQAQLIGIVTLMLWGLLTGLIICVPLSLLAHNLERSHSGGVPRRPANNPVENNTVVVAPPQGGQPTVPRHPLSPPDRERSLKG